jgi:hypothetical protein
MSRALRRAASGANQDIASSEIFHSVLAVAKRRLFSARKERLGPIPGAPMEPLRKRTLFAEHIGSETGVMPPSQGMLEVFP